MPGRPVRIMLAVTSAAPVFLTYAAMISFSHPYWALLLFVVVVLLVVLCDQVLNLYRNKLEIYPDFRIKSVKSVDQNVFTFVVAYLLPLVLGSVANINILVLIVIFGILLLTLYQSNSYTFNPLLVLLYRYHFYEVTTKRDLTYVLVSKREIKNTGTQFKGVQIAHYMFLDLKE